MNKRLTVLFFAMVFLSGCATLSGKKSSQPTVKPFKAEDKDTVVAKEEVIPAEPEVKETSAPQEEIYAPAEPKQASGQSAVSPKKLSRKQIQRALKKAGFYKGAIDGKLGKKTRKAIKEFQKANGLKADGIVGKNTRALLVNYLE